MERLASMTMAMWRSSGESGLNPELVKQIQPEHITLALNHADKANERIGEDRRDARNKWIWVLGILCVTVLATIAMLLFTQNSALLAEHFDAIVGLVAGGFGGYGIGKRMSES